MMAAIAAAENGHTVVLYEKNEKLGKKIYITGKGRCNVTNACDWQTFFDNIISNPKFMFSSFGAWNNQDMMDWLEAKGLRLKTERGNRVFPESDKSSDVIRTLQKELERLGVKIYLNTPVKELLLDGECCTGVVLMNGKRECRCGDRGDRRDFLPFDRFHRRWLPHGRTGRTEGDGNFPGIGSF